MASKFILQSLYVWSNGCLQEKKGAHHNVRTPEKTPEKNGGCSSCMNFY